MDRVVITIARQYGSGGKTIGKMLAADLGIKAYSREILKLASEDSGINERLFNQVDEKLKSTSLFGIMKRAYKGELIPPESEDFTSNQNLFNYQAKVIKELAETESCVIIGRCGDYVLKGKSPGGKRVCPRLTGVLPEAGHRAGRPCGKRRGKIYPAHGQVSGRVLPLLHRTGVERRQKL